MKKKIFLVFFLLYLTITSGYVNAQNNYIAEREKELLKIISERPDDLKPYLNAGDYYKEKRKYNKAIEYYEKGLNKYPYSLATLFKLSNTCFESGDLKGAIYYVEKAQNLAPDKKYLAYTLINLYKMNREDHKIAQVYRDLLRYNGGEKEKVRLKFTKFYGKKDDYYRDTLDQYIRSAAESPKKKVLVPEPYTKREIEINKEAKVIPVVKKQNERRKVQTIRGPIKKIVPISGTNVYNIEIPLIVYE